MSYLADLHIHSRYSLATSRELTPSYLHLWGRRKGLGLIGTGDFTHPSWLAELRESLQPSGEGFFSLKNELVLRPDEMPGVPGPDFVLTAEISNIYKRDGKVRKVHNILMAPGFETAERIQQKLRIMGYNITSDGRPILGLDSRDLLELVLEIDHSVQLIPAHIWTPWFSALGASSGFESIEECYGDLSPFIHTLETGLSSDVPMNRIVGRLDSYHLISNSDAHSPDRLGRNANRITGLKTFNGLVEALKNKQSATIDLFPQEGKYHYAGHRKCNLAMDPLQAAQNGGICSVCGKKLTRGVLDRVVELSDRTWEAAIGMSPDFQYIIPLPELLSEILEVKPGTKKTNERYHHLLTSLGPELEILLDIPVERIASKGGEALAEGIRRMREGRVYIKEGFDGEYGKIEVFRPGEARIFGQRSSLFIPNDHVAYPPPAKPSRFDLNQYLLLKPSLAAEAEKEYSRPLLNLPQESAIAHPQGPAVVLAGPGTGKTYVLTNRAKRLASEILKENERVLAITFTQKAALELRSRTRDLSGVKAGTIHAFALELLRRYSGETSPAVITEKEKIQILRDLNLFPVQKASAVAEAIARIKNHAVKVSPEDEIFSIFELYQQKLQQQNLADYEDLILRAGELLNQHPDFCRMIRQEYKYILVDEFQDVNPAQYQFLKTLAADCNNLFVIGDPHQAIYGFRGGSHDIFRIFQSDFPDAAVYRLTRSYRCTDEVLKAAYEVIQTECNLNGKEDGRRVRIVHHPTERSEAEWIARTIDEATGGTRFFSYDSGISTGEGNLKFSDFAILCRTSGQFKAITRALDDHALPWQTSREKDWMDNEAIALILDGLKDKTSSLPENPEGKKPEIAFLLFEARANLPKGILPSREEFELLIEIAGSFGSNLEGFLEFTMLHPDEFFSPAEKEAVRVMTLHSAKGLEFEHVFVTGCDEGLIPFTLFPDYGQDMAEEARLLFVGMTRAKNILTLSAASSRSLFNRVLKLQPSHFLSRISKQNASREKALPPAHPGDQQLSLF